MEARESVVTIPSEDTDFVADIVAREPGDGTFWYLRFEEGDAVYQVAITPRFVAVKEDQTRPHNWLSPRNPPPPVPPTEGLRRVQVMVRGAQLEVFVDGVAYFDPVYLPAPIRKAKLSLRVVGLKDAQLEIDRVTILEAPPLPK